MDHDRLNPIELAPDLYKALLGVERAVRQNVDGRLLHLMKLRASIVNGCSYCVDMHSAEGLADGETTVRLFAVAAWREAPFFTDAERAALALTDALTTLGPDGVPDELWAEVTDHFDDTTVLHLIGAIGTINLWNRLAICLRSTPLSAGSS